MVAPDGQYLLSDIWGDIIVLKGNAPEPPPSEECQILCEGERNADTAQ